MSQRNRFFAFLGVLTIIAAVYYFFSTDRTSDLVLVGTIDANQVVVGPKIMGRVERLAVDEGDEVKVGQTIAVYGTGPGGVGTNNQVYKILTVSATAITVDKTVTPEAS